MVRIERRDTDLKSILRRKRWSAKEAGKVVREAERSGKPLREFCRQHGLEYERLARWRRKLKRGKRGPKASPMLLPLRVVEDENGKVSEKGSGNGKQWWAVEVDGGTFRVRISEGASLELMSRALRAVREGLC
jgi:transposase-like protein